MSRDRLESYMLKLFWGDSETPDEIRRVRKDE